MKKFINWIENINQNQNLIEKLTKTCQDVYGAPPHPNVLLRWQNMPAEELQQNLKWLDVDERNRMKIKKQYELRQKEKEAQELNGYEYIEPGDTFERVVCGKTIKDMPMFKLDHLSDKFLHDYFGVYVGNADEWLDWMMDDGYCNGNIFIYEITIPPKPPFYTLNDPNSGGWAGEDASKEVPDAQIIFSTIQSIPRKYIKLKQRINEKQYWKERKQREKYY